MLTLLPMAVVSLWWENREPWTRLCSMPPCFSWRPKLHDMVGSLVELTTYKLVQCVHPQQLICYPKLVDIHNSDIIQLWWRLSCTSRFEQVAIIDLFHTAQGKPEDKSIRCELESWFDDVWCPPCLTNKHHGTADWYYLIFTFQFSLTCPKVRP